MISLILANWKYIVMAALLAVIGVDQVRIASAHAETAKVQQEFAQARQEAAEAAQKAEAAAREEEQRREQIKEDVINHATQETAIAQAAAADADRAASGLRQRLATYTAAVRKASSDPSAGKPSTSDQGADALDVFTGLLDRVGQATGQFAQYADKLRIAGESCERQYDGLQLANGKAAP